MQRNCAGIFYRNVCSRAIRFYMGIYFMQSQSRSSLRICVSTHFAKESESATNFQKRIRETNVIVWRAWWNIIIIIMWRYSYCARRSNFICTCCKVYTTNITCWPTNHETITASIHPSTQRARDGAHSCKQFFANDVYIDNTNTHIIIVSDIESFTCIIIRYRPKERHNLHTLPFEI